MKLKVKVNNSNYFNMLLNLLKDISPFSELRNRELEALAELLKYNELYRAIPKEDRMKVLFDYDTRQKIADKMGITRESLYNLMKALRDKGILGQKSITDSYDKALTKYNRITFEFVFEGEVNEENNDTKRDS